MIKKTPRILFILFILLLIADSYSINVEANNNVNKITAAAALQKLTEGNQRFVNGKLLHPDQTQERRIELAKAQNPFAIILTCSDSRLAPEIIFDQGLGDIFVVRVAGNIADDAVIGSIEYAVEHLGVALVMVLGHKNCGAVSAAALGADIPIHINSLTNAIKPAVDIAKKQKGDLIDNAVRANVALVARQLVESKPILAELVHEGKIKIVGDYYDWDDGTIQSIE